MLRLTPKELEALLLVLSVDLDALGLPQRLQGSALNVLRRLEAIRDVNRRD